MKILHTADWHVGKRLGRFDRTPEYEAVIAKYRPRLEGKRVMLYVGGLRPRHVIGAYEDLGMEVVGTGYEFAHNDDYDRTIKEMGNATLIYDDVTGLEFEEFVKKIKPDLIGSGIKEKYVFQKAGIPFRQMHSWDYSRPYRPLRSSCTYTTFDKQGPIPDHLNGGSISCA